MSTDRSPLFWAVYDRLVAEAVDTRTADLLEAAFTGESALQSCLSGGAVDRPTAADRGQARAPAKTWLLGVEVTGFRGVGKTVKLAVAPGPGLTLIVGRNGSGKSSLSEALEVVLTGDNRRWSGRSKEWRSGWRNLHHRGPVEVKATFAVEGRPPIELVRRWKDDDDLDEGTLEVRRDGKALGGVDELGWKDALVTHRPLLSYAELGSLLDDGPSRLYDSLKAILGLDELGAAMDRLAAARLTREKAIKGVKADAQTLLDRLATVGDPRARRVVAALGVKWDLDAVQAVLGETSADAPPSLVALKDLPVPPADVVAQALSQHRAAVEAQARQARSAAARQRAVADLVERALRVHTDHGDGPCPVCQTGTLDAGWSKDARQRLDELRAGAKAAEEAHTRAEQTMDRLRNLVRPPMAAVGEAAAKGYETEAVAVQQAWRAFVSPASTEPLALVTHLEATLPVLREAVARLQGRIREAFDVEEARWRPVAVEVAAWLSRARAIQPFGEQLRAIKAAEAWTKTAEDAIRRERFDPIAQRARQIWAALRQESHVELAGVSLEGTRTSRRVDLAVTVDGSTSAALGVMSQGEVNALALALFVPRLTHQDSPFHFLVVDDPVQAMDPLKVDGLAKVLHETAKTHQVVVLTHDTRLQHAVKRMQIPATVLEVSRRPGSVVEVRRAMAPVEQYLEDAFAVAKTTPAAKTAARVVPALCRLAVEAVLIEKYRARRLQAGATADDVAAALDDAKTTMDKASLAMFDAIDDPSRAKVLPDLNRRYGKASADLFQALKHHVHEPYNGSVLDMVDETRALVGKLQRDLA